MRDKHAPKLVGLTDENEVVAKLDDVAITELILAPMAKAVTVAAGCNLPAWVHETIYGVVSITIHDGREELEKEVQCQMDAKKTKPSTEQTDMAASAEPSQ
jgi:hypothetical protein